MTRDPESTTAQRYAGQLLGALGVAADHVAVADAHPALSWARSGLMALTGTRDGAAQMCPLPLAACADGALAALAALAPANRFAGLRGSMLLAERAAIAGHTRNGALSPGGACRLLPACDGHIALNLARDDDRALLPAWLECGELAADAPLLRAAIARRTMHDLVERGRELGLAVAPMVPPPGATTPWFRTTHSGVRAVRARAPRVLDLSSLWAGPLCGHLLQGCGAEVVKVESLQRPDGARRGPPPFFDLLNAGKRSVALDFSSAQGRAQLRALIAQADIVIEASRPRALRQLGIHAESLVDENPGLTWLSLSGYGRGGAPATRRREAWEREQAQGPDAKRDNVRMTVVPASPHSVGPVEGPQENWIAYGDDAGVAAGLSYLMREATGEILFVGDAIADPLTGLHAALAALACHQQGGGRLLSLALTDVVRHVIQFDRPRDADALQRRQQDWTRQLGEERAAPPQARVPRGVAAALGADTGAVLKEWQVSC